jgi:hypothetical protein
VSRSRHLDADYSREHRRRTVKATKAAVRKCPSCQRGHYPARFEIGDGRRGYVCRYCKHEWASSLDAIRIEARSDETAQRVQPEGREPGPKASPNPGDRQ